MVTIKAKIRSVTVGAYTQPVTGHCCAVLLRRPETG